MYSKFNNIDEEKQKRIINAALEEFAEHGYEKASTNKIVKKAGISKGILFHYFTNKKGLYVYLFDYSSEVLAEYFYKQIVTGEKDIMKRLIDMIKVKIKLMSVYPNLFNFIKSVYSEKVKDIEEMAKNKSKQNSKEGIKSLLEDVDYSLFKENIDIQKAMKIIIWSLEKFGEEFFEKAKIYHYNDEDYNNAFIEAEEYVNMFRELFYK